MAGTVFTGGREPTIRGKRWSLRAVLIGSMAAMVLASTAVLIGIHEVLTERAVDRQVEASLRGDARAAAGLVSAFLDPPERVADVAAELLSNGSIGFDRPDETRQYMIGVLETVDQVDGIFFGLDDGSFFYLSRDESRVGAAYRLKKTSTRPVRTTELEWWSAAGEPSEAMLDPGDTFDPRTRPWYQAAVPDAVRWTEPYVFFTSQAPGITVSRTFDSGEPTSAGVVGVDVRLHDIDGFLDDVRTTVNASAVIVTEDFSVIAHPSESVVEVSSGEPRFRRLDELSEPAARLALDAYTRAEETDHAVYEAEGVAHHAAFASIDDPPLGWLISVQAPTADYLGELTEANRTNRRLAFLFAVAASLVGLLLARGISRPLAELAEAARETVRGKSPMSVPASVFHEVDDTATALRMSHAEMETRVAERTESLLREVSERRAAEQRATAASEAKSAFLADVSHELRTPLTAIAGYAGLLANPVGHRADSSDVTEYATVIEQSAAHLLDLINDLLDLARAEAGHLDLAPSEFDVGPVVAGVLAMLSERAEVGGVELTATIQPNIRVRADERRIRQILINLVANAIKFTPEGGSVNVAAVVEDSVFRMTVTDTGIGMSSSDVEGAMQRFGQVPGATSVVGTGLGLPLVHEMAHAHGGEMTIDSAVGVGTTVVVEIPAPIGELRYEPVSSDGS